MPAEDFVCSQAVEAQTACMAPLWLSSSLCARYGCTWACSIAQLWTVKESAAWACHQPGSSHVERFICEPCEGHSSPEISLLWSHWREIHPQSTMKKRTESQGSLGFSSYSNSEGSPYTLAFNFKKCDQRPPQKLCFTLTVEQIIRILFIIEGIKHHDSSGPSLTGSYIVKNKIIF